MQSPASLHHEKAKTRPKTDHRIYSLDFWSFLLFFSARFSLRLFCGFFFSSRFGASLDFISNLRRSEFYSSSTASASGSLHSLGSKIRVLTLFRFRSMVRV